jgi:catechol 2,3-dioxygenase-like lactoylglutathione lyase family enzyme
MGHAKSSFRIAAVLALAVVAPLFAQPSDVVGLAFVGHQVANLERSIQFFEAIDFTVAEGPGEWKVDPEVNKLGDTPRAESRTAVMRVQSSVSDVPFTVVLRQYRGIPRQDWSKRKTWDLLSNHIDLTYGGNVSDLLDKLEGMNLLVMPEIQGLPNPRRQEGFRRYAFIEDPDGLLIEYFSKANPKPGDPPARPTVSNSTATPQNIDRWGKQAGFNHFAVNVADPVKARDFYMKVLGGDYPAIEDPGAKQIMQNGWYPQARTQNNLRVELVYFAMNQRVTPPAVKFQDINANYAGFEVSNIETAYARAKANGAITVSEGGIMNYQKGRAVLIRDADVGGYIMLWQAGR